MPTSINISGKLLDLSQPKVMGILNVTPDSFYDGGKYNREGILEQQVGKLLDEGADIIDIGGYSSRPDATDIPLAEEWGRVRLGIEAVRAQNANIPISVDTFRAEVAQKAVALGANMVNDISGGELDEQMFEAVAEMKVPYIMMHMRGTPQTMRQLTHYDNILEELIDYFRLKIARLTALGLHDVVIDLGFGFAKTVEQNYYLLKHLAAFQILDKPMLVGVSRKSMIYRTLGISSEEALNGTSILNTVAIQNGASILRVHDVKEAKEAIQLLDKLESASIA
jgi:dihydropteroate synthase